jgi:hypothetical protein
MCCGRGSGCHRPGIISPVVSGGTCCVEKAQAEPEGRGSFVWSVVERCASVADDEVCCASVGLAVGSAGPPLRGAVSSSSMHGRVREVVSSSGASGWCSGFPA